MHSLRTGILPQPALTRLVFWHLLGPRPPRGMSSRTTPCQVEHGDSRPLADTQPEGFHTSPQWQNGRRARSCADAKLPSVEKINVQSPTSRRGGCAGQQPIETTRVFSRTLHSPTTHALVWQKAHCHFPHPHRRGRTHGHSDL